MNERLQQWESNGWLTAQQTSSSEIGQLFQVVEQCRHDFSAPVSLDAKFQFAYQAALTLCTILVRACGFRVERDNHHFRTIQTLDVILGKSFEPDRVFLDRCRAKRNELTYCRIGIATDRDTADLLLVVERLDVEVRSWLRENHPELGVGT